MAPQEEELIKLEIEAIKDYFIPQPLFDELDEE